jgi:superfamily I DNA/RNA helicase
VRGLPSGPRCPTKRVGHETSPKLASEAPMSALSLTEEQQAVIQAPESLAAVTAYAGTGKTTTLKAFAQSRPRERMLYLAFNRAMAEESKNAFRPFPNVEVRTFHSLAYKIVGKDYQITSNLRVMDLLPFLQDQLTHYARDKYDAARLLLDAYNQWLISDALDIDIFLKKVTPRIRLQLKNFGLTQAKFKKVVKTIWKDSCQKKFPITHNGYLKLFQLQCVTTLETYDRLLVDEAQDLNDCMIDIVIRNKCKKIFVGDPYQQIYAFNGAVNAISKAQSLGAATYYLTQSFRCPQSVAELANQYLKLLNAPKTFKGIQNFDDQNQRRLPELIIARTNAGLFNFIASKIDKYMFNYNGGFEGYCFETILDIVNLTIGAKHSIKDSFIKQFPSIEQLEEYVTAANDVPTATRLKIAKKFGMEAFEIYRKMVQRVSGPQEADYIATTAHKIKGREHDSVILLDDFLALSDVLVAGRRQKAKADQGRELGDSSSLSLEEFRLLYVSLSRSRRLLAVPQAYLLSDSDITEFNDLREQGFIELRDGPA